MKNSKNANYEIHRNLLESLQESILLNKESMDEFELAKQYYEGNQLDPYTLSILESRGQPPLYENLYAMLGEKLLGYKINASVELQAIGFQKEDRATAEILTNILKSITQTKEYQITKQQCDLDLMLGICACEIWLKESVNKEDIYISIRHIPLYSLYIDPYSQKEDASDAKYFHKVLFMDSEEAKKRYGDKEFKEYYSQGANSRKRVRFYESFVKDIESNTYNRYIWNDNCVISFEKNPFDISFCPIVVRKLYIDSKNRFYGIFRNIKPFQDYINFAENRMANMLGSQKILYERSAIYNADEFAKQVSLDNAVVGVEDGALASNKIVFQNHSNDLMALSQKSEQKRALAKMQIGFNDEALGQNMSRASGVVVQQRTNAGLVGIQRFLMSSDLFDKQVFSCCVELITKYFTTNQVFRIVEQDVFEEYFEINGKDGKNKIQVGHYDINIESKPKNNSNREERFTQWVELIKSGFIPQDLMQDIIPLILDDSDSSVASQVRKLYMKKKEEEAQHANNEMAKQMQELQMKIQELQMQVLAATAKEKEAKAMKYEAQANDPDIKLPKGDK